MEKKDHTKLIMLLVPQIIILAALATATYLNTKSATVITPAVEGWQSRYITYNGDGWNADPGIVPEDAGDMSEFDMIYGPFVYAPKGAYAAVIEYSCDADQSFAVYSFENGDSIHVLENELLLHDANVFKCHFYTTGDINDLELRVRYSGEGNLSIQNIYIYSSAFYYKTALVILALIFLIVDLIAIKRICPVKEQEFDLVRYRGVWMAAAMILVMLSHSGIEFGSTVFNFFRDFGYGGVDVFFFASGIGCYLSYTKNPDAGAFLKRRVARIVPSYFIFMIPWLTYKVTVDGMPAHSVVGNLFSVESIMGSWWAFNWYVGAMWLFYILTPFMVMLIRDWTDRSWKFGMIIIFSLLFSYVFWDMYDWIIVVARVPIIFLGMWSAKCYIEKKLCIGLYDRILLGVLSILGCVALIISARDFSDYMWDKGLHWYPFILIVPGLCVLLSDISAVLCRTSSGKSIIKAIDGFGGTTWEIYLVHVAFIRLVRSLIEKTIIEDKIIYRAGALILSIPVAYLLKYVAAKVRTRVS